MTAKPLAVTGFIAMLAVIAINAMAVLLPLNNMSTGAISDLYPNLFVPAGFTFSIWSLIYILLLMFNIYQVLIASGKVLNPLAPAGRGSSEIQMSVLRLFLLTCILNISWIFLWHYLQIRLSVIIMLLFLVSLIALHRKLLALKNISAGQQLFIRLPVSVYLGWISVATIANITAWLVSESWSGWGIQPETWSSGMIITATLLGVLALIKWRDLAYTGVISWALYGIYSKQHDHALVAKTATAGMVILLAGIVFTFLKKRAAKS
ncbi:TspO/MBR family protein [Flavihumibacter stibioxidans]|uniref:Tryptophan-rich sensory protein n=1 Tax=Flavihumibacter stibioxidans TaxID=1834163 RepID=A0ABR7M8C6_9BACT|nr:TspO/MBR family protein [Flavihumibacter stibioxidans]MBC6491207.1 hypothetical protein [Flavihumibacter stibioxidans]